MTQPKYQYKGQQQFGIVSRYLCTIEEVLPEHRNDAYLLKSNRLQAGDKMSAQDTLARLVAELRSKYGHVRFLFEAVTDWTFYRNSDEVRKRAALELRELVEVTARGSMRNQ